MKNKLLILFSIFVLTPMLVMAQEAPLHRVVYLWDVTYSMHGGWVTTGCTETGKVSIGEKIYPISHYDKEHDIYDKILNALVADISAQNDRTEIVVVPFGKKVLCAWKEIATDEGKARMIQNIRDFCNIGDDVGRTGISCAMDYVQSNNMFSAQIPNTLKILTDGVENVSMSRLYHILDGWCNYADNNNIKAYYFILAQEALKVDLRKRLEDNCITVIEQLGDVVLAVSKSYISVMPDNFIVKVAEEYDKPFSFRVVFKEGKAGASCMLRFVSDNNPYFSIDEKIQVSSEINEIQLHPNYKMSHSELRQALSSDHPTDLYIHIDIEGDDEEFDLQNKSCKITMINKMMKSLKITVKQ